MAKQTEVEVKLTLKIQGAKDHLDFSDLLRPMGTTRCTHFEILKKTIVDQGITKNPKIAEKTRLMNQYKKIIYSTIGNEYDIKGKLLRAQINIHLRKLKNDSYKYRHNICLSVDKGNIKYDNINFCLGEPESIDKLKRFIDFAMTMVLNFSSITFVSDKIATVRVEYHGHKYIIAEMLDTTIKLTTTGGMTAEMAVHHTMNDSIYELYKSCDDLEAEYVDHIKTEEGVRKLLEHQAADRTEK